jgi:hypothetical protein
MEYQIGKQLGLCMDLVSIFTQGQESANGNLTKLFFGYIFGVLMIARRCLSGNPAHCAALNPTMAALMFLESGPEKQQENLGLGAVSIHIQAQDRKAVELISGLYSGANRRRTGPSLPFPGLEPIGDIYPYRIAGLFNRIKPIL